MLYRNILLIDDDGDDADVFIEAINSLDKNVTCLAETNPVNALEFLKNAKILPDLIFLDCNMPVLNGNEFIEKMRAVEKLKPIPVIVYSSYSETAAAQLSIIHDAQRYISKPNTFAELAAMLKNILEEQ